ncbi:hypothetical protein L9F63_000554 [Diploptera punctata]|uniref:C2H2-type domain-containing protein n=1 Tax=Diploptera punctata TaxID=6984 RepID=A0AAD8ET96_DIPPU|nr:hypothetical protein L9F63_000554 [Diploptera punctata]
MDYEACLSRKFTKIEPEDFKQEIKTEEIEIDNVVKHEMFLTLDPLACEEIKPEIKQTEESLEQMLENGEINVTESVPLVENVKCRVNVNNEKQFKCFICSKSYTTKYNLTAHLNIHSNERSFKCLICCKSFARKAHLQEHSYIHNNEKPFKCLLCNMSFNRKYNLSQHSYIHSIEKPFKCLFCSRSFTNKYNLTAHSYMLEHL